MTDTKTQKAGPLEDETMITEITIQPDGRVYVFGTSRQILDILVDLDPLSIKLSRLMGQVRSVEDGPAHPPGTPSTRRE